MINHLTIEPKVQMIDSGVNVKERLANLRQWQSEVRERNTQLIQRVFELEVEKESAVEKRQIRLIDQKQNLIGIMRKRYRMLTVRVPFAIPSNISRIGYNPVFDHFASQYTTLSKNEKMLWLNNLYFMVTPDVNTLITKFSLILRRTEMEEQRNLLIGGDSGSGKSRSLEWFSALWLPVVEQNRNYVPVILVEAIKDDKTTKSLLQNMVLACGVNYFHDDTVHHLFNKIGSVFQVCGVRLALIDELSHLSDLTQRRRLLEISNRTLLTSIVGASVNPSAFRDGSPEIQGRFIDTYYLKPYTGSRLSSLLAMIEILLPFSEPSHLASPTKIILEGRKESVVEWSAKFIEEKTGGSFRYIMRLLRDASEIALERNLPSISYDLLKETWEGIQSNPDDESDNL